MLPAGCTVISSAAPFPAVPSMLLISAGHPDIAGRNHLLAPLRSALQPSLSPVVGIPLPTG